MRLNTKNSVQEHATYVLGLISFLFLGYRGREWVTCRDA